MKNDKVKFSLSGEAEKIWNEIKNIHLDIFSLPDQLVEKHCAPVVVEPSKLYLTVNASAVLPALESTLKNYKVEQAGRYVIVSRNAVY